MIIKKCTLLILCGFWCQSEDCRPQPSCSKGLLLHLEQRVLYKSFVSVELPQGHFWHSHKWIAANFKNFKNLYVYFRSHVHFAILYNIHICFIVKIVLSYYWVNWPIKMGLGYLTCYILAVPYLNQLFKKFSSNDRYTDF